MCDEHLSLGGVFLVDMMVFFRPVGIGDYHEATDWPRLDRLKRMGLILKSFATNGFRQRWRRLWPPIPAGIKERPEPL